MKLICTFLFILTTFLFGCREREPSKPNILFLFADDMTYDGIHSAGNPEVRTPHLDGLVRSGLTFTHTYNMGAWHGAVCVASRTMLNTGKFLWRAKKAEDEFFPQMQIDGQFWSQVMEAHGYRTFMSGKWHLKNKPEDVFQTSVHVRPGMPGTVPQAYDRPLSEEDQEWAPWDTTLGGYWQGGMHWSEVAADDAINFLNKAKEEKSPFFMYVAFNAPHDPRQSPKEYVDSYSLDSIAVPASFLPEYPFKDGIGCGPGLRDEKLAPFPRTAYSVKVHRQEYYSIITHLDDQIGKILNFLKKTGLDKNTYVLFTADNGLAIGNHGLMGKQNMYDHGMRVPMIISGPGLPENEICDIPVYLQDIMPTSLELAGIDKPSWVEFKSLIPTYQNHEQHYPEIYGAYMNLQRMVRTNDFKLIIYPELRVIRLYNIAEDPEEMIDIADNPEYEQVIKDLAHRLKRQQEYMDDTLDLSKFFPMLY